MRTIDMETPVGCLGLSANEEGLVAVRLPLARHVPPRAFGGSGGSRTDAILSVAQLQLGEYFAGTRSTFEVPLAPQGTPFQQRVWAALSLIPFASTCSYAEIARRIGSSPRAVGNANARNPWAIIVACHRVIGAQGALVGYAGGLPMKKWLLAHERERTAGELALRG